MVGWLHGKVVVVAWQVGFTERTRVECMWPSKAGLALRHRGLGPTQGRPTHACLLTPLPSLMVASMHHATASLVLGHMRRRCMQAHHMRSPLGQDGMYMHGAHMSAHTCRAPHAHLKVVS